MAKAKLHELLAVEADLETTAKKVLQEAADTFNKKSDHFLGYVKTLHMFDENRANEEEGAQESKELVTTVQAKLDYVSKSLVRYWDALLQKEATNQTATADLVVDGMVLVEAAPATWLLGMESRLRALRLVYEAVPTWAPGIDWVPDETRGKGVYKASAPVKTDKTEKAIAWKVLVPPTDKHPAQVEKWVDNPKVGVFSHQRWISSWSSAQKSDALDRLDKLIRAVKKARQRANSAEVNKRKAAQVLVDYLRGE